MWFHPDGHRILIPRPGADGTYPDEIVEDLFRMHDIPPPKPVN